MNHEHPQAEHHGQRTRHGGVQAATNRMRRLARRAFSEWADDVMREVARLEAVDRARSQQAAPQHLRLASVSARRLVAVDARPRNVARLRLVVPNAAHAGQPPEECQAPALPGEGADRAVVTVEG